MGARLVSLALVRWTHVSDRAFRVLIRMALTALDEPSPNAPSNLYYGGRELLALTLRNEGGSETTRYRVVRKSIAELIDVGAIERAHHGRAGQNTVYRLTLDRQPQEVPTVPPQEVPDVPPQEVPTVPPRGYQAYPPRNHEEPVEERLEEEGVDLRTALTGPRASDAAAEPDSIPCQECVRGYVLTGDQLTRCPDCLPDNVIPIRPVA